MSITVSGNVRPKVWADFNESEGDSMWTSLKRSAVRVVRGQQVLLGDHEGNTVEAVVDHIRGPIAYFTCDWSTWADGTGSGEPAADEKRTWCQTPRADHPFGNYCTCGWALSVHRCASCRRAIGDIGLDCGTPTFHSGEPEGP